MKKIILATDLFRPSPGGIEGFYASLARSWNSEKMRVHITSKGKYSENDFGPEMQFDEKERYRIVRFPSRKMNLNYFNGKKKFIESVRNEIREFAPDHILIGNISPQLLLYSRIARSLAVPFSVVINGEDLHALRGMPGYRYKDLFLESRYLFALSSYIKAKLESGKSFFPPDKIQILPPAVVMPSVFRLKKINLPVDISRKLKNKTVVLCLGPLVSWKGFDRVIEAAVHLMDLEDKFHILITGTGREFQYIKELIRVKRLEAAVTLTGFLPDYILEEVFRHSHIFFQPHKKAKDAGQGLSMSLMETAARGIPSVVGRVGGIDELVADGISGYCVDSEQPVDAALRLRQLILSERNRKLMGRNAEKHARENFKMDNLIRYLDIRL